MYNLTIPMNPLDIPIVGRACDIKTWHISKWPKRYEPAWREKFTPVTVSAAHKLMKPIVQAE